MWCQCLFIGLVLVSLIGGSLASWGVLWIMHQERPRFAWDTFFVGLVERAFFTIIIAFDVSGAAIAMIGWTTLKAVARKERHGEPAGEDIPPIRLEFASIVAGLVSMLAALIGGLSCHKLAYFLLKG